MPTNGERHWGDARRGVMFFVFSGMTRVGSFRVQGQGQTCFMATACECEKCEEHSPMPGTMCGAWAQPWATGPLKQPWGWKQMQMGQVGAGVLMFFLFVFFLNNCMTCLTMRPRWTGSMCIRDRCEFGLTWKDAPGASLWSAEIETGSWLKTGAGHWTNQTFSRRSWRRWNTNTTHDDRMNGYKVNFCFLL